MRHSSRSAAAALALLLAAAPLAAQQARTTKPAPKPTAKAPAKPATRPATKPGTRPVTAKPATGAKPAAGAKPTAVAKPVAGSKSGVASKPAPRAAAARPTPAPARPVVAPAALPVAAALDPDALRAARRVPLAPAPEGAAIGSLDAGAVVTPVARAGGWVKVRVEAWVPDAALQPADAELGVPLAAADLRADPEGTRGRAVRWEVEILAFQVADALRRELVPGEPYLLARGPGRENAILYLALPPSLVEQARGLAPLTRALVMARVRNGRSAPTGVPVLDLSAVTPVRKR